MRRNFYAGYCFALRHVQLLHITYFLYHCEAKKSIFCFLSFLRRILSVLLSMPVLNFDADVDDTRPPRQFFCSADDHNLLFVRRANLREI